MVNIFKNLFGRRAQPGFFARNATPRRGGMALGTIATIAAPFVIRKLMQRRASRQVAPNPA